MSAAGRLLPAVVLDAVLVFLQEAVLASPRWSTSADTARCRTMFLPDSQAYRNVEGLHVSPSLAGRACRMAVSTAHCDPQQEQVHDIGSCHTDVMRIWDGGKVVVGS